MRLRAMLLTGIGLVIAFLLYAFWPETYAGQLPRDIKLAVWMGVTWSMDVHSDADIATLAAELREQQIADAYVYVSYLRADDSFNDTYEHTAAFTRRLRTLAPDVTLFAWLGVPISIERSDGTVIANRLENPAIRQQIADFATFTITDLGFDGFHLNAELIPNEDKGFLHTLAAVRAALPVGTPFSTTAHALRLQGSVTLIPYPQVAHHWSLEYLRQVALYTDQIALMAYDSGLPFPRDYRSWVGYQTRTAAEALANSDVELLIGLPVSEEWTWSHQTQAETLDNALSGFGQSFSDNIAGIALYPHWEIDPNEWRQIRAIIP